MAATKPKRDDTLKAVAVSVVATAALYLLLILILILWLPGIFETIAQDPNLKIIFYVLIYQIPMVLAPFLGLKLTGVIVQTFTREFVYYVFVFLIVFGSLLFALLVLLGGGWQAIIIACLQIAVAWCAWRSVKMALGLGRGANLPAKTEKP